MPDLKVGNFANSGQQYSTELIPEQQTEQTPNQVDDVIKVVTTPNEPPTENGNNDGNTPPAGNEPPASQENQPQTVEINDELVFKFLSEKLGREIKSDEDLIERQTVEVNSLDSDPYLKNLFEWRQQTGRPVEDYFKFKKDWGTVADLDVARELLQHEYPTLNDDEINFEMRKFIPSEYDDDEAITAKKLELKKYATRGRESFAKLQKDLGEPTVTRFTPEVQQQLDFAQKAYEYFQGKESNDLKYLEGVTQATTSASSVELNLLDGLKINFNVPEDSKKTLPEMITTMPTWRNEDGSQNYQAIVNDGIKIRHFDDIMKIVAEQAFNAGKESIIKDTKNVNTAEPTPTVLPNGSKIKVEGLNEWLGKGNGMQVKFGRK